MIKRDNLQIEDYNYELPDERIAKYPLRQRDQSQLLVYNKGELQKDHFSNIPDFIPPESTLVFNNTKVIQARLKFYKNTGAQVEIFCLEPISPSDYILSFQQNKKVIWKCIVGNLKKWKTEELVKKIIVEQVEIELKAKKIKTELNSVIIEFSWDNSDYTFSEILENIGLTPIPPYLNRESEDIDKDRYQTIYSQFNGSVAAPTAGLHFTNDVINKLKKKKITIEEITLHVGAGTFKPVKAESALEHEMHTEHFIIQKSTIENLLKSSKIITVGTTSVRTLESLYWLGVKLIVLNRFETHISQWEVYESDQTLSRANALQALLNYMEKEKFSEFKASTQIMILPGYRFKMADILITNFHQPKSTLILLVAAFIGDKWKRVYDFALENDFRFLSYGDSSILIP
ncbi:MAG: S-adenosylmethionine tRNA ribosyltransferase [Bacteroidetes bacterium GWC2_33_15]|nr:MAG: S-adenosylmethionine tRNA ribosyltransferase [Bacteroidetes bacterium GWA2_33_15]OFX50615.1 MAG: S-adenosylmethionine tRNA ribosyltransferase [Bacteroidetes bacterium GWC2_33_15]OFX64152.1 MAG: S-adenosylmethionine tRNA ribosyltransferase [Bacteroidetes bacterium GWB2_32_14]OFX69764.1 MAG: S-adenosylmethionine tRNA ribosyltransferase [Bacteroidetes bacterium GWD2_33_33]HAN19801.1 S-adenosylmethionine tRNA ribosyltransferase [Bacteroidales bacterium]